MDSSTRARRAIKTPKRFDDEAFGPSPKQQLPPKVPQNQEAAAAKPLPEPVTPKNIIKVKLTKPRPTKLEQPIKSEPSTKDILKSKETPKLKEPAKLKEPTAPKAKESIKTKEPTKLKESIKPAKELVKQPKEPAKPKEVVKPKENVAKQPKETARARESVKQKELVKLKDFPKIDIKTPERDAQLVYRPRTKRPKTPPIYADLIPNVVLPFWDARTAAEDHEDDNVKELVHCHCGVAEELGLMVQCETCLTWQHAHCLGIERPEDAPDGYTCRACSDPKFSRDSMKWAYDQDWLTKGRMKQFPCDTNPLPENKADTFKQINMLIGHALQIHKLIHSVRVKTRLLMEASDDDPELKLFRVQWPANYQHRDGSHYIPTINHPSSTPASTISAIADTETPDPGDITIETVNDVTLPDIGHLEDVTAILENPYVSSAPPMQSSTVANNEMTPNDCRANLRLHIQQTEEFIGLELAQIEEHLAVLERDCDLNPPSKFRFTKGKEMEGSLETSLDSLKNDLQTMKKYITLKKQRCES